MDNDDVPSDLIRIIKSYLNNEREVKFTYESETFYKRLTKGCPQDGPLSPLLWNILLNDLLINFDSMNADIICYADDVTIICWNKTIEGLKPASEYTLNYVIQWCNRKKLTISTEKTNMLYLHNRQKIPIKVNNNIIMPVKQVKILGMKFSNHKWKNKVNFTPHVNDILCKAGRMKNLLCSLSGNMWGLDTQKRLTSFKTIIRPVLTYGSEIWFKYLNNRCKQNLNSMQYQISLWAVRAYKTTSSNCVHSLAKIPLLTDYIESRIIKFDLAQLSIEDLITYEPHAPSIVKSFLHAKLNENFENTNEIFRSFFVFGIPRFFRPIFYNIQFITDHGNFGKFLATIGAVKEPGCFCGGEIQDARHLLLDCPIFRDFRENRFGRIGQLDEFVDKKEKDHGFWLMALVKIVKIPLDPVWISRNKVRPRLTRAISPKPWSLGRHLSVCQSWCCGFFTDPRPLVCGNATNSQKFLYADDIALLHQEQSFSTLEQILNEDLKKLENFFSKWHLIPNPSKTVSSVFHLNNHKANRPLKLIFCNKPLSHDPCPKYLGVTLDRSLTFRQHLEKTRDKLKTRNNIMTRLAGTTWGCGADTLRTTALALVYSVAEYCAPVWERSSHTDSIDAQLNQTMRLITGNMRPTPIDWLPYLSNIAPPDLRRKKSTSNLLSKIKANTKLPINTVLEIPPPTRLISRNPAWVADENVDLKEEWRNRWSNLAIANKDLVEDPNTKPPGYNLPRRTWSTLNRIRTSTGRCNYLLNKWNMSPDQNCDCGQIPNNAPYPKGLSSKILPGNTWGYPPVHRGGPGVDSSPRHSTLEKLANIVVLCCKKQYHTQYIYIWS
ncbi:hypothetical protein LAZ67_3001785 [Cordylochernes scorpioides]|uniref:Reverse transcriptase domain-containing protein n=1 Tax=Cordylochernes scorpioides TaxID=51811 RepID=A0ABY6KBX0_9ARAC|nr:hypothetical protein LAZ67_3001785 [Cordylochernes scorpioides]